MYNENIIKDIQRKEIMSQKAKQIGFLSALAIVVGTVIGAGIFFKNQSVLQNTAANIGGTLAAWIISAIGVMAIALCLIELTSATKNDKGILAWVKNFTKKWISRFSSSYMLIFYLPLTIMALSLFVVQSIQDASGGTIKFSGWDAALIGFALFVWLSLTSFFSIKASGILQWIFTIGGNALPLIIIPIIAFFNTGNPGVNSSFSLPSNQPTGLSQFFLGFGILASIPAIMFSFDGFYTATALRSKLKDPKKLPKIMIIGLVIVTFMYLFLTIGFLLGSKDGTADGVFNLGVEIPNWFAVTLQTFISIAVLSTLNGYAISSSPIFHATDQEKELRFIDWFRRKLKIKNAETAAFVVFFGFVTIAFIVITPIGLYGWKIGDNGKYGDVGTLYNIINIVTNFASIMAYLFIGLAIHGAFLNRKRNFVKVKKFKYFKIAAWVSLIFVYVSVAFFFIDAIAAIPLAKDWDGVITSSVQLGFFIFSLLICFAITFLEKWNDKKNHKNEPEPIIIDELHIADNL